MDHQFLFPENTSKKAKKEVRGSIGAPVGRSTGSTPALPQAATTTFTAIGLKRRLNCSLNKNMESWLWELPVKLGPN